MTSLGIRAETSAVNWAVVTGSTDEPVLVATETASAPVSYDEAGALGWFRNALAQLIETYSPEVVAIRSPETVRGPSLQTSMHRRCRVEGVIMETAQSSGLKVVVGPLATISKNLGTRAAKHYLETTELRGIDWSKHPKNRREAILAGASVLPASGVEEA